MTTVPENLIRALEAVPGLRVGRDVPMSARTSFGVGGPADVYLEPTTPVSFLEAMRLARADGLATVVLGRGTNVVVGDAGVRGLVVSTYPGLRRLQILGSRVAATAGTLIGTLVHEAADAGLSGLEATAGIPGTLGGALLMNAGANGTSLGDVVETVTALDRDGGVRVLGPDEVSFGYRHTSLCDDGLCPIEATLKLAASTPQRVHHRMYEIVGTRCQKQPVSARSAGSIFKRPPHDYAGHLLEVSGAKGLRVGDAQISAKHANFIVNVGHATAADVVELIRRAQRLVFDHHGVLLEPEVCLIGEGLEVLKPQHCGAAT